MPDDDDGGSVLQPGNVARKQGMSVVNSKAGTVRPDLRNDLQRKSLLDVATDRGIFTGDKDDPWVKRILENLDPAEAAKARDWVIEAIDKGYGVIYDCDIRDPSTVTTVTFTVEDDTFTTPPIRHIRSTPAP